MMSIGFMQGRFSPLVDGKIQAFPTRHWREEFALAERHGFELMEWTLDHEGLRENPLMTRAGRREIKALQARHNLGIPSVTGDCFMQAPFFKVEGARSSALFDELQDVIGAAAELGLRFVLIPLVDNGRIETPGQAARLHAGLEKIVPVLRDAGMKVVFESDFPPAALTQFIAAFPAECFGVNYDIGNSASLGHDPAEEIGAYGDRIDNVHVKDRLLGGTTVPLGEGNADLPRVFRLLRRSGYAGNYILQTARARDGEDHAAALCRYRDMVRGWLSEELDP